ncbi:hypothetical protein LTR10_018314 [Elasticomyces elasticus]|uniref:3-oxo-5-alpha-steroid 4-dehydrogenase C-terminal domain-containing protein n=1 Tax=Exophiala sideris TaxID=1016849 RepID=A0ABR0JME1_9EURO|nr:hypothetical protein LTR10_018314 [Elasticomyces elasticus]KAK5024217.1 hypothetical protein LTR13_011000 [Exophiala sideris]KAK5036704.1 hypothetical protein LTS07_002432 [Exophiala sideris]KAK5067088.1 hypothetical protein LTR69_002437 [Exophiala sideris]KAK5186738.1 hypothetical protein LTR44_000744 [Eurotiomycetes sp. CCFEE 6388]
MTSWMSSLPSLGEFFPPTPRAFSFNFNFFRLWPILSILQWTPLGKLQAMGKTSIASRFNLPGRLAWCLAESVGPLNLLYIIYTLPAKIRPAPQSSTSFLGTTLPMQCELLACLYIIHYVNRAFIMPLFTAPSMSPIHPIIAAAMALHQYLNSSNIGSWLVYSTLEGDFWDRTIFSFNAVCLTIVGLAMFNEGLWSNIQAETTLHNLRRDAAKRRAKSEGKVEVTYDKVYVIPPPEGYFKNILFPHYVWEWLEWTGYWILGGAWGLGWGYQSPALWFVIVEIATMLPRAVRQLGWYEEKFGKRAIAGRAAVIPGYL